MDIKSSKIVEQIYYQILHEAPEDINQFIHQASAGNKKIIAQVLALLEIEQYDTFDETDKGVLQNLSSLINNQADDFDSERYQLIQKIGQGGMGSVYLANRIDGEVEQKVAIKIINSSLMTQDNIIRFKKERQILASLNHNNIARFIDAGSKSNGLLFVVMEYIKGKTLSNYCHENKLSTEQKLTLYLQLCDAIEYAHKNFIIHRDIKPSNILVKDNGILKLLDFGIAKLFDDNSARLVTTAKIMTPAYASPEQLTGKNITILSDIYALGVVLFELILGKRPFQELEKDNHAFQSQVLHGLTTKPSQLTHVKIKKRSILDIDAILIKAINPDTKLRYQSVFELKQDIKNYIKGYPVKARKANSWYFFTLFIKRNKLITVLSGLILITISAFSFYSYQQNKALELKGKELSAQRDNAILQAQKAKLASQFLLDSFQTADPTRTFGEKLTIKQVILDSYNKLKQKPIQDKQLNAELLLTISNAFYGMDAMDLAFESSNLALSKNKNNKKLSPNLKVKLLIARAKAYFAKRNYRKSLIDLNSALINCQSIKTQEPCLFDEIYFIMAKNYGNQKQTKLAKDFVEKSLSYLQDTKIDTSRYIPKKLYLSRLENALNNPDKTLILIKQINDKLSGNDAISNYYKLLADNILSAAYRIKKEFNKALEINQSTLLTIEQRFSSNSIIYAETLRDKAAILADLGKNKQAIAVLKQAIAIKQNLKLAAEIEYNQIGWIYAAKLNNNHKSIEFYEKAIEINDKVNYKANENAALFRRNLAFAYYRLKDYNKMQSLLYEVREIFQNQGDNFSKEILEVDEWIKFTQDKIKAENNFSP